MLERIEIVPCPKGKDPRRGIWWRCRCTCGNDQYIATAGDLNSGRIKSCGCWRKSGEVQVRHGYARANTTGKHKTWKIWTGIIARCTYPSASGWKYYGGRGIRVDESWKIFENFLRDMGECPENCEIDRIDPYGHYAPGNCRWVTHAENMKNLRIHK